MRSTTGIAVIALSLLPGLRVGGDEPRERVNSRGVYAYYTAGEALAMARATRKPIFVISVRGNDCAGGL